MGHPGGWVTSHGSLNCLRFGLNPSRLEQDLGMIPRLEKGVFADLPPEFMLLLEASGLPSQSRSSGCKVEKRTPMKMALVPSHSQFLGLFCIKGFLEGSRVRSLGDRMKHLLDSLPKNLPSCLGVRLLRNSASNDSLRWQVGGHRGAGRGVPVTFNQAMQGTIGYFTEHTQRGTCNLPKCENMSESLFFMHYPWLSSPISQVVPG